MSSHVSLDGVKWEEGKYFFKAKANPAHGTEQKACTQDIWSSVRVLLQPGDVSEELWVAPCRICKETSKDGPNNNTDIKCHWK